MKNFFKILSFIGLGFSSFMNISGAQAMVNENLSLRQQAIVPIAAFTATGDLDKLNLALNEGLNSGLTVNEIKEVLVQIYAYAGFPRSLNGLNTFMEILNKREQAGIYDTPGKEASPLPDNTSRIELGTEIQTKLAGSPVSGPLFDFSPVIDHFLKVHLFGDIFGRDNLNFQDREITTIAALASMKGVGSQLQSHLGIGMNVGLTEAQINQLILVLRNKVGESEANDTRDIFQRVLSTKNTK